MQMSQKKVITKHLKKRIVKTKSIEAGGGVVYRFLKDSRIEVLLIYRNGVWDIPKGKREKKESKEECAKREVMEEVNADSLPKIVDSLDSTFHTYIQKNKTFNKTTYWYTMVFETEQSFSPQVSEGIEKVQWVELGEAKEKVGYENLKQVLDETESKLNSKA